MDYENKKEKLPAYTCFCNRKFKEGEDPIYKQFKTLKDIKQKNNYRKYPKTEKIIDFKFKQGKKVSMMDKEKKPPTSGKLKMKTYGNMDWTTRL